MPKQTRQSQFGVSNDMIDRYGDDIFQLSHNKQTRRGDPVRKLDFEAIEAQRAELGLTDAEISERVGLAEEQVMVIRTIVEHRRFHTGHYKRLYKLGGGKRYRPEREEGEN